MTVDELINKLTALNIDHQEVRVELEIKKSWNTMTAEVEAIEFKNTGLVLVLTGEMRS